VLKDMRRLYTREAYIELVNLIRSKIPHIALSSDFIAGFCGETNQDFLETISLLEEVKYEMTYLFAYSMRDKTHAYHNLKDDVPEEEKKKRLQRMIDVFKKHQLERNKQEINSFHLVLVEGIDKKTKSKWVGRTDTNKICIFEDVKIPFVSNLNLHHLNPIHQTEKESIHEIRKADYVIVKIIDVSNNSLFGIPLVKLKSVDGFFSLSNKNPKIKV
jgi:tRNA A37 methylthiotransferase MiaB